jgi:ferrous iron transport protein B
VSDQEATAEDAGSVDRHLRRHGGRFDGAAGAFAYLLFILLYFPCTAAIAAVYQESGARWTIFVAGWTTGLAYGAGDALLPGGDLRVMRRRWWLRWQ